ncbi:hypothetical protein SLNWT_3944 [Streptomyces albus]|uniref:Uncharacterized protein n=1 Tax=Streptomyces albus (strain ATCC 21838 / DSM 41398 / FERM P-419 / JCM 4703 / NBRC 107858) TaxID=1081613 RepID=A0A0B5EYE6_STRA4|nr:hypothetical protein SLNWT_3944 [Streptomyces albus]AYN34369.1 hypothetical protein DUI70_3869 [Streptomyces albus]
MSQRTVIVLTTVSSLLGRDGDHVDALPRAGAPHPRRSRRARIPLPRPAPGRTAPGLAR